MSDERKVIIIAGPNGAGKTTFAREFLPAEAGLPVFVNADLIAAGFTPFDPGAAAFRAGRLMFEEITVMPPPDAASHSRRRSPGTRTRGGSIAGARMATPPS